MRHHAYVLSAAFMTFALGCGSETAQQTTSSPVSKSSSHSSATTPVAASVNLETKSDGITLDIKSWDETLELVAQHKGKVVVLDLWSTSCKPCLDEFPNLVALQKQFGNDKLVCMSASCDFAGIKGMPPESYKAQVLEFLTKQEARFPNVLLNVESDALFEKLDLASNPAVYVFGQDGQIAKRFDNDNAKRGAEFTYEKDIVPFVTKLIAE